LLFIVCNTAELWKEFLALKTFYFCTRLDTIGNGPKVDFYVVYELILLKKSFLLYL
jgi:hypothetical protein